MPTTHRRALRVVAFAAICATNSCGGDATRPTPTPSAATAFITLLPTTGSVVRGVDYPLTTVVADSAGRPMTGQTVTYGSADPSIATVSPAGMVHPIANGVVTISGTVNGRAQATSKLTVLDARTVSGQVLTADGAAPADLVFVALAGSGTSAQRFSTIVDARSGAFSLRLPDFPASTPFVDYLVDATPGSGRKYHPSYRRTTDFFVPPNAARILLIPHSVVPDSGTYAGRLFPVSLDEAFVAVCTNTSDQNCESYWPSYFLSGIKTWPDAARPIPLAIDRTTGTVSGSDSVAIWSTIRAMETDLGRSLYRPAAFKGYTSSGYTAGMVLASLDQSVAPFTGFTNWSWDGQGTIFQAKVRLASSQVFANTSMVTHELTHALGFHHTCRWSTVMGSYGCPQQNRLTSVDVAYYHLAEMVRRRVIAVNPTWSIAEALLGVRVVELGIAPSAAIMSGAFALRSRLSLPGSDGAP